MYKEITVKFRPWLIVALIVLFPTLAIAAGTVLTAPVSVAAHLTTAGFSASNSYTGPAISASNSSTGPAISASATSSGIAIQATALGTAVKGSSTNQVGIYGATTNRSLTTHSHSTGVYGVDQSTDGGTLNSGVFGQSARGAGINGSSTSGTGAIGSSSTGTGVTGVSTSGVGVIAQTGSSNVPALRVVSASSQSSQPVLTARNGAGQEILSLDGGGNLLLYGSLTEFTAPLVAVRNTIGTTTATYASTSSSPSVEASGQANLTYGRAHVVLDPTFASVISTNARYLVFVTPEVNTRGVFVTNKTPHGFDVLENLGGRSTGPVSYRIVAQPNGLAGRRIPLSPTSRL